MVVNWAISPWILGYFGNLLVAKLSEGRRDLSKFTSGGAGGGFGSKSNLSNRVLSVSPRDPTTNPPPQPLSSSTSSPKLKEKRKPIFSIYSPTFILKFALYGTIYCMVSAGFMTLSWILFYPGGSPLSRFISHSLYFSMAVLAPPYWFLYVRVQRRNASSNSPSKSRSVRSKKKTGGDVGSQM